MNSPYWDRLLGALFGGAGQTRTAAGDVVFAQNAAFFWVPLIVLAALCAYFFMNNLNVSQASPKEQARVTTDASTPGS